MNSINEKEKKLNIALEELKNLDLTNPELQKNIENLSTKQNQLEIEKTQIEERYKTLLEEHENLSKKLAYLKKKDDNLIQIGSRAIAIVGHGETIWEAEQIAEKNILKVKGPLFHRKDIGTTDLIQKKINHMSSLK